VQSLNHGIGFNTAAIELLLPTYGEQLGLKGKICKHWTLNPHPTLIPAIESGWVESVHCFGGELGMEEYIRARPDIFFTGADGSMRSNRAFCQLAGQYAVDMFIGSTLQVDGYANSSTVTRGRLSGFGGAPNMGHDPHGRRHATPAWLNMITEPDPMQRGKKLVVQMVETFQAGVKPTFVEKLDAVEVAKTSGMPLAPVMIYGDDVTHVLTEEGIAYLYRAESLEERRAMVAAVAGITDIGLGVDAKRVAELRQSGKVVYPEDIGIRRSDATRSLLAAGSVPTWWNGPTVCTTHLQNSGAGNETSPQIQVEGGAEWLARTATQCLIDEARLSPKPGLVDSRGNGAHHDLILALMERSAHSLPRRFRRWRSKAGGVRPTSPCAKPLAGLAAKAKQQMMAATGGVNTHRGAIWALGLLVSAVAMLGGRARRRRRHRRRPGPSAGRRAPKVFSKGLRASHRYRVPGAREEAQQAFPHIMQLALPQLCAAGPRGQRGARPA
jgi:hypothetical protein